MIYDTMMEDGGWRMEDGGWRMEKDEVFAKVWNADVKIYINY